MTGDAIFINECPLIRGARYGLIRRRSLRLRSSGLGARLRGSGRRFRRRGRGLPIYKGDRNRRQTATTKRFFFMNAPPHKTDRFCDRFDSKL